MNKLKLVIGIFAMLLGIITTSYGQSFEFAKDSSSLNGEAGMIIKVGNNITNLTEDTVEFRWVRAASNLPADWQNCGVCDNNKCYTDADSATFMLLPSGNGDMSINFYPFDDEGNPVKGSGSLTVLVYPVDSGRSHAQQAFFQASTNFSSIEDSRADEFKIYPNPVNDVLKVKTVTSGTHKVTIYNTSGIQIKSTNFTGQETHEWNINGLDPGTYFIRYQNEQGKYATTPFLKK